MFVQKADCNVLGCVCKNRSWVNRRPPSRMGQNLAKAGAVAFIVQQALHPVDFAVDLVAVGRDHWQTRARVDVVRPVSLRDNLFAKVLGKVDKLMPENE